MSPTPPGSIASLSLRKGRGQSPAEILGSCSILVSPTGPSLNASNLVSEWLTRSKKHGKGSEPQPAVYCPSETPAWELTAT